MSKIQTSELVMREVPGLFPEQETAKSKRIKDKLAQFDLATYLNPAQEPFFQSAHGALFDGD